MPPNLQNGDRSAPAAAPAAPAPTRIPHDLALDGARGVAVLMVVFSHFAKLGIPVDSPLNLRGTGRYGVFLFFVLSSFLLTRQIMAAPAASIRTGRYWANYALRRFLRVYPAFTLALLMYATFYHGPAHQLPAWQDVWRHLALQQGMSMFWTIPVEFKYYLLLPFVALLFRALLKSMVGALASFALILAVVSWLAPPERGIVLWSFIPVFVCGDFASFLVMRMERPGTPRVARVVAEIAGWCGMAFALSLIPGIIGKLAPGLLEGGAEDFKAFQLWYVPFGLAFGAVVVASVQGAGPMRAVMSWRPLVLVGRVSYSLYLLHMLVMSWSMDWTQSVPLRVAYSVAGSALLAWAGYTFVERPLARIRLAGV